MELKDYQKTTLSIIGQYLGLLDLYSAEVLTFGNAFDILEIAKNTRPVFARIHGGFYNSYNTYFRRENDR
ncbi:MAG: hypothetical protein AAB785_01060 [Patescibacteria group bacterium]